MNFVVDTNIVFSAVLNTNSRIAGILTEYHDVVNFYSPTFLLLELDKHRGKLTNTLKVGSQDVLELQHLVTQYIHFVNESQISRNNWIKAEELTSSVDSDDIAFVALSLELKCPLWTGDKKLLSKISDIQMLSTEQITDHLKK